MGEDLVIHINFKKGVDEKELLYYLLEDGSQNFLYLCDASILC